VLVLYPSPALEDLKVPLLLPPLRPTKLLQELGQEEKELRLCLAIHHRERLLRPTKLQEERELRLRLAIHHRKRLLRPTKPQEEELHLRLAILQRQRVRPTKPILLQHRELVIPLRR
jgi:hypothetical protein